MKGDDDVTVPYETCFARKGAPGNLSAGGRRALMAKLANIMGRPIPMTAGKGMRRCSAECTRVGGHHTADETIKCF